MNWELCLRSRVMHIRKSSGTEKGFGVVLPEVSNALAHHPPIHEQDRAVRLRRRCRAAIKQEADRSVDGGRNTEVEGGDEEANTSCIVRQAVREVA